MSKKLVLFGEGPGDLAAIPVLVQRLLTEHNGWDALHMDNATPFRCGNVHKLAKNWSRWLQAAAKRGQVGGVLLVLDGDAGTFPVNSQQPFCAKVVARELTQQARDVGAGVAFSVAVVFARMEFESWLIAGVESLVGRLPVRHGTIPPQGDLEENPRDAKGWLSQHMDTGYSPTRDQESLTKAVDLELIRQRRMRSFRRLEHAIDELIHANRTGQHVCTPA